MCRHILIQAGRLHSNSIDIKSWANKCLINLISKKFPLSVAKKHLFMKKIEFLFQDQSFTGLSGSKHNCAEDSIEAAKIINFMHYDK